MAAHAEGSPDLYGRKLPIVRDLDIGPTVAAAVVGNRLYTIGRGTLRVFDLADPAQPELMSELGGLGNTRQLTVADGIAYVTSREDSAFIVDVRDPKQPKLLCHYDAIEVATGVAVSGNVLFLACRSHGVELVDITDPAKPEHLSVARTGEAQSVAVRDGYAYVGVWGSSELVVVDVRNSRQPKITVRCQLDGFGDGVFVRGGQVYVATGHHSRERKSWHPKEGEPGYGQGHGLEIYSLADPAKPTFVSRIKTPPFYHLGNDMWSVKVAGDHAFLADTHNGLFVVNVADPAKPRFVARRQLPLVPERGLPGYVGGLALAKDHVYVAGGWTDLHVVSANGLAEPTVPEASTPPAIPPFQPREDERFHIYRPDGQVRGAAFVGNTAIVAAGSDGIHTVELGARIEPLNQYDTDGFAMAVEALGDTVYVAEERGGLSIWRCEDGGRLSPLGRYRPKGRIVREVAIPRRGKYGLLLLDMSILDIVDVSDPPRPASVFTDKGHGFLYHLADDLIDDRYVCLLWQLHGLRWYDLYGGPKPAFAGRTYEHRLGGDGSVPLGDDRLVVFRGGYVVVGPDEQRPPFELPLHRVADHGLRGQVQRHGDLLYLSSRETGDLSIVDISDHESPKLVEQFNVPGNPGRVVVHDGRLVIPNGYEGLWVSSEVSSGK